MQCRCVQSLRKIQSCRGGRCCNGRIGMALHWTSSIFWILLPQIMPAHRHIQRDHSHPEVASQFAVSYIACAHTQVSSIVSRSLTRSRARKPAHTRRRMLLSTANLQAIYLRGHGCWLVIVDRHGRGLKATFQVGLALIQIRKREVRRTDASALGKSTFDNLPGSTHARN